MNHLTDEDLVLHYYGEEADGLAAERHLEECDACREQYGALQRLLNLADAVPAPERSADYGSAVWSRLERQIPGARRRFGVFGWLPWRWAVAAPAFAGLLVAAFLAGRFYSQPAQPSRVLADAQVRERVLLVAMGDYLDRSQMVLAELANSQAGRPLDITEEQERAQDLISETRLYRQTAAMAGKNDLTAILDEVERVLLDISHQPAQLSAAQVERLHQRLDAEGIIFKIRVVNANVRGQEEAPDPSRQKL